MRCSLCDEKENIDSIFSIVAIKNNLAKMYCKKCLEQLIPMNLEKCCKQCGSDFPLKDMLCQNCLFFYEKEKLVYQHYAAFAYSTFWKEYIWKIKHDCTYPFIMKLAQVLKNNFDRHFDYSKVIFIPYPTDEKALRQRGFNLPSMLLKEANLPSLDLFEVISNKEKQHKQSLEKRLIHCQKKLCIKENIEIPQNKKLIVFDDIYTSGATVVSALLALREKSIQCYDSASLFR